MKRTILIAILLIFFRVQIAHTQTIEDADCYAFHPFVCGTRNSDISDYWGMDGFYYFDNSVGRFEYGEWLIRRPK